MAVTKLLQHSIRARVLHGSSAGKEILIGRAKLDQNMGSFHLQRCQLPIRVTFAMTINKAQGLTLKRVGVYLEADVFSHSQLYVAFSRCGDDENLWVFGPQPDKEGRMWIKNVVYKEVLVDT
jgi:ATP-dependent DNA helicase PIF1